MGQSKKKHWSRPRKITKKEQFMLLFYHLLPVEGVTIYTLLMLHWMDSPPKHSSSIVLDLEISTLQFQIINIINLNINKRKGPNKRGGVWNLFSVRSGNPLPIIMGIALAKSRSARGASQQTAFMVDYLTISHTCLPSHVFPSFAFLMFSVFTFKEKWESLHSMLRQD